MTRQSADRPAIIGLETGSQMDPRYGGVLSYRVDEDGNHIDSFGDGISTPESRAKADVPQWRKFELGRLEIVDNVVIPGPAALPKDEKQYGENVKLTNRHKVEQRQHPKADPDRIMPDDPNFTPLEKALSWAGETHHGPHHQAKWSGVAAALGADNGYPPMSLNEAEGHWERHGRNRRWTMAVNAIEKIEADDVGATNRYREAVGLPPAEESQADADARERETEADEIREIEAIERALGGDKPQYRLSVGAEYGPVPPREGATGWYTRHEKWLPKWYWDLPEMTHEEARAAEMTSKANVAPYHYIFHKKGKGIIGRQKRSEERTDLPIWTTDEALAYYRRKGIRMHSHAWLDGHLMTRKGYTDTGNYRGKPIARVADEDYEASHRTVTAPTDMAAAIAAGDWAKVAELAAARAAGQKATP